MDPVAPRIGKEPQQLVHAATRKRAMAARTCSVPGECSTSDWVLHGAQVTESDARKITTTGNPNAAAMWAGPESFPTNSEAWLNSCLISASGVPEKVRYAANGERSSPGPPMNTG